MKIAIEATPDPIRAIRVQVNGRQVEELTPDIGSGGFGAGEQFLDVPLAKGRNEVRVTLTNAIGEKAETLTLTHDGEGDLDKRGTLYILAIGVDKYQGLGNTCGERQRAATSSIPVPTPAGWPRRSRSGSAPGHTRVVKRVLVNGGDAKDAPTASNIIDAVELLRQADETDTVVLFIAGHGKNDGPDYRFLATNAEWTGGALRGSTVVPWQVLQSAVEAAKGRRHAVRRHLPFRQRLQPAARQRRLSRQHHRLHRGPLRSGGAGGRQSRARPLHLCGGRGP